MNNKPFCTFILIIFISLTSLQADELQWEFNLGLDKEEYLLGENIWLDVSITNVSDDTLWKPIFIPSKGQGFHFIVKDSLGEKITNTTYYASMSFSQKVYPIDPKEYIYECFNLTILYEDLKELKGNFTIEAYIDLPFETDCYFDKLASNKLGFKILEPEGDEKLAYRALYVESAEISYDKIEKYYQECLEKYPKSVYAESYFNNFYRRGYDTNTEENEKKFDQINFTNKILRQFPASGYYDYWIDFIIYKSGIEINNESAKLFLKNLIQARPNTRIAKFAEKKINRFHEKNDFVICESEYTEENKWDFTISLSKQRYKLHESIWIDLLIQNVSGDTLKSDCTILLKENGLKFLVTDSLNNELNFTLNIISYSDWDDNSHFFKRKTNLIAPGEYIYYSLSLEAFFNALSECPGKYSVKAILDYSKQYYNQYLFNDLESNILTFYIDELNESELQKYKEYNRISSTARSLRNIHWRKDKSEEELLKLKEYVLSKYEYDLQSLFAEKINSVILRYTTDSLKNEKTGMCDYNRLDEIMLNQFPNSGRAISRVSSLSRGLEKEDKIEFLNQVIVKYPNTRAAKFAQQEIYRATRKQVYKQ